MPRLPLSVPAYARHRASGQAVVRLSGRDVYLGRHGTPESRQRYDRFVAEWLANGRQSPDPVSAPTDKGLTVDELILSYLTFANGHYRKNGEPTNEVRNIKDSFRPLHRIYGATPAAEFGPKRLKTVREDMIAAGLARGVINQRVGRIVRAFKWAGSEEFVPASVYHALRTVMGLQKGRTAARETAPVLPVSDADVEAIRPHVAPQVWAMVQLQRLSGMRPGEVVGMRTGDLDTSGRVWSYRPAGHKMEHRGRERVVVLGPKAQGVLTPWLRPNPDETLFRPCDADARHKAELRRHRKTRVQPSQRDRSKPGARRKPGVSYSTKSYGIAIRRGCQLAGVPVWSPNRLRHTAATELRREFGIDVAQAVLGHASPTTTLIYAEVDLARASDAMLRIG